MLNKYDFTNNDDVIDQPSILKITSDLVLIIHAGGTSPDTKEIPEEGLVILIGNIDSFIPSTPDPIIPDDPEPIPTPTPEDGITMTVMIVNSAGGKLNIRQLQLLLWDEDNLQIQSVTGAVTTNNRIEQGSSARCTVIFEKEYEDLHFASGEQYSERSYLCNCGYKINGSNHTFTTSGVSESYIFQDGGSFTVTIPNNTTEWMGGGQTPTYDTDPDPGPDPTPTPSGDDHAPETTEYSTAEQTGGNGIRFIITNNTGSEARFTGKVILNIAKSPTDWSSYRQVNAHIHGPQSTSSWDRNDIIIPAGGSYISPEITTIDAADNGTAANFTDGTWYLMNSINGAYGYPIFLYTREYSRSRNATSGSQNMYAAAPTQNVQLLIGYTYHLNLYWKNPYASLDPDKSGTRYIILAENQTNLLSN